MHEIKKKVLIMKALFLLLIFAVVDCRFAASNSCGDDPITRLFPFIKYWPHDEVNLHTFFENSSDFRFSETHLFRRMSFHG